MTKPCFGLWMLKTFLKMAWYPGLAACVMAVEIEYSGRTRMAPSEF